MPASLFVEIKTNLLNFFQVCHLDTLAQVREIFYYIN